MHALPHRCGTWGGNHRPARCRAERTGARTAAHHSQGPLRNHGIRVAVRTGRTDSHAGHECSQTLQGGFPMNSIVNSPIPGPIVFDPQTVGAEVDYGTPESTSTEQVTLEIDGIAVTVPKGTSIMRAAKEIG